MTKEKVQNKVQIIQWLKKKYKIKYKNTMTEEKVQNKAQKSNDWRKSTK